MGEISDTELVFQRTDVLAQVELTLARGNGSQCAAYPCDNNGMDWDNLRRKQCS
jgi:hypothetical protein